MYTESTTETDLDMIALVKWIRITNAISRQKTVAYYLFLWLKGYTLYYHLYISIH